jgi:hypothetical protein
MISLVAVAPRLNPLRRPVGYHLTLPTCHYVNPAAAWLARQARH